MHTDVLEGLRWRSRRQRLRQIVLANRLLVSLSRERTGEVILTVQRLVRSTGDKPDKVELYQLTARAADVAEPGALEGQTRVIISTLEGVSSLRCEDGEDESAAAVSEQSESRAAYAVALANGLYIKVRWVDAFHVTVGATFESPSGHKALDLYAMLRERKPQFRSESSRQGDDKLLFTNEELCLVPAMIAWLGSFKHAAFVGSTERNRTFA